ncbi:50S ribosomal protein L32 [Patescibacteria group bacterium]|nr:50S ribosomal protein L32 [Patescibacteria group bacterium]
MGLPSQKRTKSSKKRRASHFALKKSSLNKCPKCQKPILAHRACRFCGYYKGREVIKIKSSLDKKAKKEKKEK